MIFTGELADMGAALGKPVKDPDTLKAMVPIGLPESTLEFTDESGKVEHFIAEGDHAELVFKDDLLDSIIVWTTEDADHSAYARPDRLIDGLPGNATRAQVQSRFGAPIDTRPHVDRYPWESNFVIFEYVDDRVVGLTLMSRVPGEEE